MSRKLYKSLKAQKDQTEQVKLTIYGSLGIPLNGRKVIQVADRQGYVYVRLRDNQNEVIQAFNNKVAASYDLPVIVVREGGRYIVQQYNSQRYLNNAQNSAPFLPGHGTQHSFPRGGGADITWVYGQQIMPALVYPEATTGTNVMIEKYPLLTPSGRWVYAGGTGTQNILQHIPTTGSSSLMALVYMDAITGNPGILVGSGTYFPASITGSVYPYLPSPSSTQIPLAGVLLNTGTRTIGWDNIYDVRQWVHATPSGTSSGGSGIDTIGFVGQNKGVYLATGTVLNVNGTRLSMSASGTVFNLTNSPDPQELIGIYGMSGTTGLGTGTSMSFGYGISASITGTFLYVGVATNAIRELLTANRTYYVRTDGNDSNTGLVNSAGGAFLTIQKAVDVISGTLDISTYTVTIQLGNGTYSNTGITLKSCVGAGSVTIIGDTTTPTNVVVTTTGAGTVTFQALNVTTIYDIQGIQFTSSATGTPVGIYSLRGSFVRFQNVNFAMNGYHLRCDDTGKLQASGNYTISASATYHIYMEMNSITRIQSKTVTITGTPAFTAFIIALDGAAAKLAGNTFSGSATGSRYSVLTNAAVTTGGATLPGNAAGTTDGFGVYS